MFQVLIKQKLNEKSYGCCSNEPLGQYLRIKRTIMLNESKTIPPSSKAFRTLLVDKDHHTLLSIILVAVLVVSRVNLYTKRV